MKKGGDELNIKELRKALQVTPEELAHMIGYSQTTYYYKMRGKRQWELLDIVKLYDIMKTVSDDEVLEVKAGGELYEIRITKKA